MALATTRRDWDGGKECSWFGQYDISNTKTKSIKHTFATGFSELSDLQ